MYLFIYLFIYLCIDLFIYISLTAQSTAQGHLSANRKKPKYKQRKKQNEKKRGRKTETEEGRNVPQPLVATGIQFSLAWLSCRLRSIGTRNTGDVAQWLARRNSNSKTLGSIPWPGRVRDSCTGVFCCPDELAFVQTCLCLTPLSCVRNAHTCAHVKDPMSMVRSANPAIT